MSKDTPRHAWQTNCRSEFVSDKHCVILDEADLVPGVAFCQKCPPPSRPALNSPSSADAAEARLVVD